jgi:UDP-N-acetylglucosamine diphosphorylase/glucosamine-1-phosphate N-acetyltransferase
LLDEEKRQQNFFFLEIEGDVKKMTRLIKDNFGEIVMRKCGAIILAAGKGTRMKSERAKVVYKMAEKPLVQRVANTAISIDCDLLGVVVGYRKNEVIDALPFSERIHFVEQKEQKGTGHAVMAARELFADFEGDVLILCGDVPLLRKETLEELLKTHRDNQAACTVLTAILEEPASYGRIVRSKNGDVQRIVEFKDATPEEREIREINTGIYCFDSQLLFSSLEQIGNNNKQGEYYLTDTLEILNSRHKKVLGVVVADIDEVTGINSQKELAMLETNLYRRVKEHWLMNGVSIENPDTVIIGEDVIIDRDVVIESNVVIKGESRIGADCRIGVNSYIKNGVIQNGVVLEGANIVVNSLLTNNSRLTYQEKRVNE